MLAQFTWQEFWLAMLLLTLLWYPGIILLYYRKELNSFFSKGSNPKEPLPHRWSDRVEEPNQKPEEHDGLLGASKPAVGTSTVSMGQISFGQDENAKSEQLGLIPDVLQELKEIFSILEKEDGNKQDFFNMMEMVRAKYGQIGSNPRIVQINQFIAEHAPFHLSKEELENLWD
ncbi:hypothetical protein [Pedobacter nototheniae]|uniref:hypothetical protein n=1 Tax=Pedobacter nototheniae TaxID=2488994 RepID=UPI002931E0E0|nr:hypothetical protein [Pedobacter nototheniae]